MIGGMEGLTISEVAQETGFSPSALRFYESAGLVNPARTPAGYRSYDEASLDTLRFVARAKRLGLSLDDISDLLGLLDGQRCEPVQDRLRVLLQAKTAEAVDQAASLTAVTAQLQQVAARLGTHTPDGPCDDACGCTSDLAAAEATPAPVPVTSEPRARADGPIACSLAPGEMQGRLADWQEALRDVTGREPLQGGVRVHLPRHTSISRLATLIEAEQTCCQFFTFVLTIGTGTLTLDVTAPEGAQDIVHALVGVPPAA